MAYQVEHLSGDFELIDHDEIRWLALDELNSIQWAPVDIPLVSLYIKMLAASSNTSSLAPNT